MNKKLLAATVAAVSLVSAAPAMANFTCGANPNAYLGLNSEGWVAVSVNGVGVQSVCSVSNTVGGVSPEACQGWYSTLLTWRALGRQGVFYYNPDNSANQGKTACSQFAPWEIRIPYFLEAS